MLGRTFNCFYQLATKYRNPSLEFQLKALLSYDFAPASAVRELQADKLKELLLFASNHSKYWRQKLSEAGVDSEIINADPYKALGWLPISTKADYLQFGNEIQVSGKHFNKVFRAETSGSTGEPLKFPKNEYWDSANRASIARGLSWYGVRIQDRNGYLWGFDFSVISRAKVAILDAAQNRFRLFSYDPLSMQQFLKKARRAKYIHGYSSVLNELAIYCSVKGVQLPELKLVKATSEKIFDSYVENSFKAFALPMVSEYGSAEAGIIAFECPNGKMHINEENVYVEVVDQKIVVTNLNSKSFPFIRYELGDIVELSEDPCACGRSHRVILDVAGRVGKNIIGSGDAKFPSLTLYYICKNLAIKGVMFSYKARQSKAGELVYVVKYDGSLSHDELIAMIKDESKKYFSDRLSLNIIVSDSLYAKEKKMKDFESSL